MRDPERIDAILQTLRTVWHQEPDLQLGQLLVIAARPEEPCPEIFSIEDEHLVQGLLRYQQALASSGGRSDA